MITRLKDTLLLVGNMDSERVSLRNVFSSTYNLLEAESSNQACMLLKQKLCKFRNERNRKIIYAKIPCVFQHF